MYQYGLGITCPTFCYFLLFILFPPSFFCLILVSLTLSPIFYFILILSFFLFRPYSIPDLAYDFFCTYLHEI